MAGAGAMAGMAIGAPGGANGDAMGGATGGGAYAGAAGGGAAAGEAATLATIENMSVAESPHTPQNAAPLSSGERQRGQFDGVRGGGGAPAGTGAAAEGIAAPHMRQNRIPGGLSTPQRGQASTG